MKYRSNEKYWCQFHEILITRLYFIKSNPYLENKTKIRSFTENNGVEVSCLFSFMMLSVDFYVKMKKKGQKLVLHKRYEKRESRYNQMSKASKYMIPEKSKSKVEGLIDLNKNLSKAKSDRLKEVLL